MTMRVVKSSLDLAESHLNRAMLALERTICHTLDHGAACSETLRRIDTLDLLHINKRQLVSVRKQLGLD